MSKLKKIIDDYCRAYRKKLGFNRQNDARDFLAAKDIVPAVDFGYLKLLNERLYALVDKMNTVVCDDIRNNQPNAFKREFIDRTFKIMEKNDILPRLNNLGRRPEQVYFSWMRGFVVSNFFLKALSQIFEVGLSRIVLIGDDSLKNPETFKKAPTADLEMELNSGEKLRIKLQSSVTMNDSVREEEIFEAKDFFHKSSIHTMVIHINLIRNQVAFFKLDEVEVDYNDNHWMIETDDERGPTFCIDQNYFFWDLINVPPKISEVYEAYNS